MRVWLILAHQRQMVSLWFVIPAKAGIQRSIALCLQGGWFSKVSVLNLDFRLRGNDKI